MSIAINYGFVNATAAILVVGALIFLTSIPIAYYASSYGVDIDLLTRGAGFGYIGSTITSLIYASFTFLFFAIEAAIMSLALEMCFGVPLFIGYIISSLVVIPLVTHGITLISRFQAWTQPFWLFLHLLPFVFIAIYAPRSFEEWTQFRGTAETTRTTFNILLFGTASTVVFSLIAQIGEQVDFLRFLPARGAKRNWGWWAAYLSAGPGWIVPGVLKMLAGSFLAFLAIQNLVPVDKAAEPTQMYLVAFQYVFSSPEIALAFTGAFVIISQLKINVTNAYAGSIAWSNFFSRLTHSHPGRVVWLVFNVTIALLLMELGIFKMLEHILGLYSIVAVAWVGALVADLMINKPLGLSPAGIEFKRAHLYDINPVGVGSMLAATVAGIAAITGALGATLQSLSAFVALAVAFVMAPAIAYLTKGRFYIARTPRQDGPACTSCAARSASTSSRPKTWPTARPTRVRSARCAARWKRAAATAASRKRGSRDRPAACSARYSRSGPCGRSTPMSGAISGILLLFSGVIGSVLLLIYLQVSLDAEIPKQALRSTLWSIFLILTIIAGVAAWLFVLAQDSRRVAEEETSRQTDLLMNEIEAHKRTDAKLQQAKEVAEAASKAKSRHVVGLSHELRTPLNAILGYSQLLERDPGMPPRRTEAIKVVRRSAEHLAGLIDGLLDISKIEAGRFHLNRNEVRTSDFLDQIVDMFRLQATAKGIEFNYLPSAVLPAVVHTDENRLRQILINLLSNAIKFTEAGQVTFRVKYRYQVAEFEIEDTGIGIHQRDLERIFQPFEHARTARAKATAGTGLGLTITKLLTNVMGGNITVTSAVGKGSVFRLKMLLSEVSRPRIVSTQEDRVRGYVGPRQSVLVVDDNEIQRNLVRDMLAPLGFTVSTASGGRDCLSLAEREKPNLIFLDIAMPEMDGWQVAQRLRQSSHGTDRDRRSVGQRHRPRPVGGRRTAPRRLPDEADRSAPAPQDHPCLLNIEWIYDPGRSRVIRRRRQRWPIRFPPTAGSTSSSASARSAMSGKFRKSWPASSAKRPNTRASSIRCARS